MRLTFVRGFIVAALLAAFGLVVGAKQAGQHPCDDPTLQNQVITTNGPVGIGFCEAAKDDKGTTYVFTKFRIQADGVDVWSGPLAAVGGPSSSGLNYFETPKAISLAKGAHSIVAYATTADGESAGSAPFVLTLKAPAPPAPVIKKAVS